MKRFIYTLSLSIILITVNAPIVFANSDASHVTTKESSTIQAISSLEQGNIATANSYGICTTTCQVIYLYCLNSCSGFGCSTACSIELGACLFFCGGLPEQ
jgi:hypothetical protein